MAASPNEVNMEEKDRNATAVGMQGTKMARRVIALLVVLLVVLLIGMFVFAYLALEMTKEMHQTNGDLVDAGGHRLSTSPRLDELPSGITISEKRLLSVSSNSSKCMETEYEMPAAYYQKVKDDYANGATDMIVPMPGGVRVKIEIEGFNYHTVWGKTMMCDTGLTWMASCTSGQMMCPIRMRPMSEQRRLQDRSMPGTGTSSKLDRSLDDKCATPA